MAITITITIAITSTTIIATIIILTITIIHISTSTTITTILTWGPFLRSSPNKEPNLMGSILGWPVCCKTDFEGLGFRVSFSISIQDLVFK